MLRSMYAGISGMRGFQTKLDVVGNNIANVNTAGYKKSRITFQDLMSQTEQGAQGPEGGRGGINPRQVGLGAQVGSIDTVDTQGFLQPTGRALDIAIEGDGFFRVGEVDSDNPSEASNTFYTRAGNFYLDEEGYVVTADGYYLLQHDENGNYPDGDDGVRIKIDPENTQSFSIGKNGTVNIVDSSGDLQSDQRISLAIFANPEGMEKMGTNLYVPSTNSGEPTEGHPGDDGFGDFAAGSLEMSNVDLAEEFTEMITAQRAFQANTRIITTSDEILQELVNLKR